MRKLIIGLLFIFSISTLYALSAERILFNEAESRYKNGDLDFALSRYEDLLQEYPLSEYAPDAYFRIAVITLRSGALEEAESLFFPCRETVHEHPVYRLSAILEGFNKV